MNFHTPEVSGSAAGDYYQLYFGPDESTVEAADPAHPQASRPQEIGVSSWGAYVPDLPGCVAAGGSREEVMRLIQEAIEFLLGFVGVRVSTETRYDGRCKPGSRRPVLVVQSDPFNQSRISTVVVAVVTSAPGNVRLIKSDAGLPRASLVNVSQVLTIDRTLRTQP